MAEQTAQPGFLQPPKEMYYVCTIGGFGDYSDQVKILDDCLKSNVYKLHANAHWPAPLGRVKKCDKLLLKFQNRLVAWGIAKDKVRVESEDFDEGWNRIVDVDCWRSKTPGNRFDGVHHYGIQAATKPGAGQFAVVKEVEAEWAEQVLSYFTITEATCSDAADEAATVLCRQASLAELFEGSLFCRPLAIPNYQRCFCWRKRDVLALLESLRFAARDANNVDVRESNVDVHLGTLILKRNTDCFDIVDGQQRLLTLTLLLNTLGYAHLPLLESSLAGKSTNANSARKHLWWANTTIKEWLNSWKAKPVAGDIVARARFCVVVLPQDSEDLAYSFFDAVNSAGKRLSDYDLLKAHHLRFVGEEKVAETMAERWDKTEAKELDNVLHQTLYRLRVWSRHGNPLVDAQNGHQLFRHYSATASKFEGLFYPPLSLTYNSTIRGGATFFHYAEQYHLLLCDLTKTTEAAVSLREKLSGHSGNVLRDSIAALLFLYYCRFGRLYLDDALFCIAETVSALRNGKQVRATAISDTLFKDCVWAIDAATDPGQFIDWCLAPERQYTPLRERERRERYWNALADLYDALKPRMRVCAYECEKRRGHLKPAAPAQAGLTQEINP